MNNYFKKFLTILGIYIGTILLGIIFSDAMGYFHSSIFNIECGNSIFIIMNFNKGCIIEGFIYSYIFWLAILSFIFLKQKIAWVIFIFGTFLFWLTSLLAIIESPSYVNSASIGTFIIMLCSLVIGYGIGLGIKKIMNKKN